MKITWPDKHGTLVSHPVDANVRPYVEALGMELAAKFFLHFGGAYIYFAENPQEASELMSVVGEDGVLRLAHFVGCGNIPRVPLAKKFLARYFASKGDSIPSIARQLRTSDVSVRKMLADPASEEVTKRRVAQKQMLMLLTDAREAASEMLANDNDKQKTTKKRIGLRSGSL